MSPKKNKNHHPKFLGSPLGKNEVRQGTGMDEWQQSPVLFLFSQFDIDGPWGIEALKSHSWQEVFEKIEGYQQMVWSELYGPKKPNHEIRTECLSKKAQNRFASLQLDIVTDTLISLHVTGKKRLYGIRDRQVCRLLWFDPWHDREDKAVCPSHKKHT